MADVYVFDAHDPDVPGDVRVEITAWAEADAWLEVRDAFPGWDIELAVTIEREEQAA